MISLFASSYSVFRFASSVSISASFRSFSIFVSGFVVVPQAFCGL